MKTFEQLLTETNTTRAVSIAARLKGPINRLKKLLPRTSANKIQAINKRTDPKTYHESELGPEGQRIAKVKKNLNISELDHEDDIEYEIRSKAPAKPVKEAIKHIESGSISQGKKNFYITRQKGESKPTVKRIEKKEPKSVKETESFSSILRKKVGASGPSKPSGVNLKKAMPDKGNIKK